MTTERHRRIATRLAALALATLGMIGVQPTAASSDEAVVLASTAPGYQTGKLLDPSGPVSVPDEASLSLLFADGRMATLEGPYSGPLAEASLAALETGAAGGQPGDWDYSAIGGTRSAQGLGRPLVDVDLETGGHFCLDRNTGLRLQAPQDAATASIQNVATGELVHLALDDPYGPSWPETLPIERNARFRVALDGMLQSDLQFTTRRSDTDGPGEWLAFLRSSGCDSQWQEQLELTRDRLVPFDIYLTSSDGRDPVMSTRQPLDFYVRANRDGYVYCYAEDSNGRIVPFFPQRARRAAVMGEQFTPVMERDDAPRLMRTLSSGPLIARCLGADRDPGPALPQNLRQADFSPAGADTRAALEAQLAGGETFTVVEMRLTLAN